MARWCFLLLFVPLTGLAQCWMYQKSGVGVSLRGVAVLDSLRRVAVGGGGTILRTTDGGTTWTRLTTNTATDLTGLAFATPSHGLAVGSSGTVFRTTDGGATWTRKLNVTLAWLKAVAFPDTLHAVAVGDWISTAILRSSDGGKTWSQQDIPWIDVMNAVAFADSDNGIFSGDQRLVSTTDGGLGWEILREGDPFEGLSMPSLANAAMVGGGMIFTSTDGLLTLQPHSAGAGFALHGVHFTGQDTGYVVGDGFVHGEWGGIILHTSDAGAGWDTVFIPGTVLRAVHQTPDGRVTAVGDNGVVVSLAAACTPPPAPALLAPADGLIGLPLLTTETASGLATLEWAYPAFVSLLGSDLQVSTDSAFAGGYLHEEFVQLSASRIQLRASVAGLNAGTTYYWRVRMRFRDGDSTTWTPAWRFTTASGTIRGTVFSDPDADGLPSGGDPPLAGWKVSIGGTVQTSVLTDAQGSYVMRGLAAGTYLVTSAPLNRWVRTTLPETTGVSMGPGDSLDVPPIGFHYLKNSVGGTVFNDRNETGIRDPGEEGLSGWVVRLAGADADSVLTDAGGVYLLDDVGPGTSTVTLVARPGWEQLQPVLGLGHSVTFSGYGTLLDSMDFSAHEIPPRVKNELWVSDSTRVNARFIWWGVRPSTADGIWGVDPLATLSDYAEGEFDLPPPTDGVFDARFVRPPASDGVYGNGSWTDMQAYASPSQTDTFKVAFQPGTFFTGGYPMYLRWDKEAMAAGFTGPVFMEHTAIGTIDMKAVDSLVVVNPLVGNLLIVAEGPNIPTVDVTEPEGIPLRFALEQNFPNPFNPVTVVRYALPAASRVSVRIYDLLGRQVATLVDEVQAPGRREARWNAADEGGRALASGIYLCRMQAVPLEGGRPAFTGSRKLAYIR